MFYFAGRVHQWGKYIDFDINTDNPNEYWRLSYDNETNCWYALQMISENEDAPFEDGRMADKIEISQMLATMPVNQLPASALLGG